MSDEISTCARIASTIATRLTAMGLVAAVRALPPFPSKTPETGAVIQVALGGELRPVALAETWHVRAYGPRREERVTWDWNADAFPLGGPMRVPTELVADGIGKLTQSWEAHRDEVGMLDVVLALLEMVPDLRAHVFERDAWVGLERGARRWPAFGYVEMKSDHVALVFFGASEADDDRRWELRTRADVAAAHPDIIACAAKLTAWCERFVENRRAIERFADILSVELGKAHLPPFGEHWRVSQVPVDQFGVRERPTARLTAVGTTMYEDDAGRVVVDGVTYDEGTPFTTLVEAVHAKAAAGFSLREGDHYRLKRPINDFEMGAVLTFRGAQDIRPNDTLLYTFGRDVDPTHRDQRVLSLSEVDPADAAVMKAMQDWFEWVEYEVHPDMARKHRVSSLTLVGKHLREHGELEFAERRLREAVSLDPNHALATFQLGWVAAQRGRWAEGVELIHRARTLDPSDVHWKNNEAWALGHVGRWQEALVLLDELAVDKPDWVLVHRNRAWILRLLGRLDEARVACERALAIEPANEGAKEEARLIAAASPKP